MNTITDTALQSNLAKTMDKVCEDRTPVTITRSNARPVVMLSLEDYQAIEETAYLLCSPNNAKRLLDSTIELDAGKGQEKELIE